MLSVPSNSALHTSLADVSRICLELHGWGAPCARDCDPFDCDLFSQLNLTTSLQCVNILRP